MFTQLEAMLGCEDPYSASRVAPDLRLELERALRVAPFQLRVADPTEQDDPSHRGDLLGFGPLQPTSVVLDRLVVVLSVRGQLPTELIEFDVPRHRVMGKALERGLGQRRDLIRFVHTTEAAQHAHAHAQGVGPNDIVPRSLRQDGGLVQKLQGLFVATPSHRHAGQPDERVCLTRFVARLLGGLERALRQRERLVALARVPQRLRLRQHAARRGVGAPLRHRGERLAALQIRGLGGQRVRGSDHVFVGRV